MDVREGAEDDAGGAVLIPMASTLQIPRGTGAACLGAALSLFLVECSVLRNRFTGDYGGGGNPGATP
jgi:hypothetical protein